MKTIKIIIGLILISGPILSISTLLKNNNNIATLIIPIIVLIFGLWLIKSGLSSTKK